MKELQLEAKIENLDTVIGSAEEFLEENGCSMKEAMQITIAVEEIYVNIAHYAYAPETGMATVQMELIEDPKGVKFTFIDEGIPFDPLAKEDPDVDAPLEKRQIGGLGIFMVKQSMDEVHYERKDNKNIFSMTKKF